MFGLKKPINVTHTVELDSETVDHAADQLREILKTVGIALAIGIPATILFGVAANAAADIYVANHLN